MEFPTTWISLISYGVRVSEIIEGFSHEIPDLMEGELCFRAFKARHSLMDRGLSANPKFHMIPKIPRKMLLNDGMLSSKKPWSLR